MLALVAYISNMLGKCCLLEYVMVYRCRLRDWRLRIIRFIEELEALFGYMEGRGGSVLWVANSPMTSVYQKHSRLYSLLYTSNLGYLYRKASTMGRVA